MKVSHEVERRIDERIKLWSKDKKEWACVLTGYLGTERENAIPVVTDFFEISNLKTNGGLMINLQDILRIAENHFTIALLHSHPSNDLTPSPSDIATFIYTEILLKENKKNPILYIIASPNGERLILSFAKCWECPNSFFKLIKIKGR